MPSLAEVGIVYENELMTGQTWVNKSERVKLVFQVSSYSL